MFTFRPGTTDQRIYTHVVEHNEYRLQSRFDEQDVIVDVGAHIGSFTYAALLRGAAKVYTFEADRENLECASRNLENYLSNGRVSLQHAAVWRSDVADEAVYHGGYSVESNDVVNTGGAGVLWAKQGEQLPTIALDEIIRIASEDETKPIRLLKIDCEGAEWPILLTSSKLAIVREVCGEFHEIGGKYNLQSAPFMIPGYDSFTVDTLSKLFKKNGFHFTYHRGREFDGSHGHCGYFFATQCGYSTPEYWRFLIRLNFLIRLRSMYDHLKLRLNQH